MGKNENSQEKEKLQKLTPLQYRVTQEKGTEPAFSGDLWDNKEQGIYRCIVCGEPLFDSESKYDSGSGWPSFFRPLSEERLESETDKSHGMVREEVHCARCGAHMGHLFPDGPRPTGLRYCINSASLEFEKRGEES